MRRFQKIFESAERSYTSLLLFGIGLLVFIAIVDFARMSAKSFKVPSTQSRAPEIRPETPEPGSTVPVIRRSTDLADLSPLAAFTLGERNSFIPELKLEPPYIPVESVRFKAQSKTIVLFGMQGPGVETVCQDDQQSLWACGRQAQVALYNQLRMKAVTCSPPLGRLRVARTATEEQAVCFVDGKNLALELTRLGWIRPLGLTDRSFAEAQAEADAARRGLWNGSWTIIR